MRELGHDFGAKMRVFLVKMRPLGLEKGQKPGFAVTDSLLGNHYKHLITRWLQAMQGVENTFSIG
jgi:hypothetical protein